MDNYDRFDNQGQGRSVKSPDALYEEIQRLINSGSKKEAIGALEMFLSMQPNYAVAHNDLGVLYYGEGEKEKALAHYERAAQLEPYNDVFQKNLADFYYIEAGRMGEALQIYVKLLDANPTDIETLLILGQICVSLKKTDDARVFYNRVLEVEPWNLDAREKLDELGEGTEIGDGRREAGDGRREAGDGRPEIGGRGQGFGEEGSPTGFVDTPDKMYQDAQRLMNDNRKMEAMDALERLVVSYPDYALAHNDLGVLYYNEGDQEKTLHHYEKAAALEPRNPVFQKNLADFYYAILGRIEAALEIYLKILEVDPTDMETLLIMGHICVSLRKFDDARVFYNRVLEIEPWNVDAREKLDQLGEGTENGDGRTEDGDGRREIGGGRMEAGGRCVLSLILSHENSERLIRNSDEVELSGISDQVEIVVGDKALRQDGPGVIQEIQSQSKNIIYVETGESYPQNAVDALKFVARGVNDNRNAADIKRDLAELSLASGISASDPDMADRFISLFERLSDTLKALTNPFQAPSVAPKAPAPEKKAAAKKNRDVSDDAYKEEILRRVIAMRNEKDLGWKDIAEVFNSEGLPTLSGKGQWHRKTIYRMYQKAVK
ncbi:MAG: tetratricopeptide repeat protein [Deltaproteobacteria bacterium]|nr:tetratricopeptide repeat protein [Deltaproteobacteria bacterium]